VAHSLPFAGYYPPGCDAM